MEKGDERGLTLAELLRELESNSDLALRSAGGSPETDVARALRIVDVTQDSRKVLPGALFAVRVGQTSDGTKYVADAKRRGAIALLAHASVASASTFDAHGLPVLVTRDFRRTLARAAAAVHRHPSFGVDVVGITGTNGKSTTTHLFAQAYFSVFGIPVGLIGTLGTGLLGALRETAHTTPEVDDLQRSLAEMKRANALAIAMEVSSIALAVGRVDAVHFRAAAWLNFTQDHLDFHGTMDAYMEAKRALFLEHRPAQSVLVVDHAPIAALARQLQAMGDAVVTVSLDPNVPATFRVVERTFSIRGTHLKIEGPGGPFEIRSPLIGRHNVENLATTLALAYALEYDAHAFADALAQCTGAPGRLERCDDFEAGDDITVLVDYSHTPDALVNAIASVRAFAEDARVVCVFGCGGDRDPTKREPMGKVVAQGVDRAIVTNDNPRSERPEVIADAIALGLRAGGMAENRYVVELDRRAAIERAIVGAEPRDIVLLCGKGHETYQIVGTERLAFDDRVVAREALQKRRQSRPIK